MIALQFSKSGSDFRGFALRGRVLNALGVCYIEQLLLKKERNERKNYTKIKKETVKGEGFTYALSLEEKHFLGVRRQL